MDLRVMELTGTPQEMGRQHGEALAGQIAQLSEDRLCRALADAGSHATRDQALALAARHLDIQAQYAPAVHAEFMGIAEGAGIDPRLLLVGNGYTDFRDVLGQSTAGAAGCSAFIAGGPATADGALYMGQTWDMHASAEPHVVVFRRKPKEGPASITLTTAGCLSLLGVNEAGLVVQNTNLVPTDARPGAIYLALIHQALAQTRFEDAVAAITQAPRASGHNYLVGSADGRVVDIETTATRHATLEPRDGLLVHTNHYRAEALIPLQAPGHPMASSLARQARLEQLLAGRRGWLTPALLQPMLMDHAGGDALCLCRHAWADDARTCAAAIFSPLSRRMWACAGPPCSGRWAQIEV